MKITFFYAFIFIFVSYTSLGMDRDESPMRVDTPRSIARETVPAREEGAGPSGRASPTPPSSPEVEMSDVETSSSLDLNIFAGQLKEAVGEVDLEEINRLSSVFKDSETLGEGEGKRKAEGIGALRWHLQPASWKAVVGGEIFFSVLDEPHLNLIRQALQPLKDLQGESSWEEAYEQSRSHVFEVIKRHTRFHHLALLQSLAVSASFNHPIARLIVVEYMHLLNDKLEFVDRDRSDFLNQNYRFISLSLKGSQDRLKSFLSVDTEEYIDLEGEDLKNKEKVLVKSQLGLPYYDILLGRMCLKAGWGGYPSIKDSSLQDIKAAISHYEVSLQKGDPEAASVIAHTFRIAGVEGKMHSTGAQYIQYIKQACNVGYFDAYSKIAKRNGERLYYYKLFKELLGGRI